MDHDAVQETAIETANGRFVDLLNPDPQSIFLDDIVHHLSRICRYHGAIPRHYSVAEHVILVHDLLLHQGASVDEQRAGLLHDAHEAYIGDLAAPLKRTLRAAPGGDLILDQLESRLDQAVAERFGLDPALFHAPVVRACDVWACRIEAEVLSRSGGRSWVWPDDLPMGGARPETVTIDTSFEGPDDRLIRWTLLERMESVGLQPAAR